MKYLNLKGTLISDFIQISKINIFEDEALNKEINKTFKKKVKIK